MTENRAVEVLEYIRETGNGETPYVGCAQNIAIDMAIQALEDVQKYRAIGTVEECQQRKEYFDIINEVLKNYSDIGTIEECRTAVERMKPKRPNDIVMAKDRKICVGRIGKCPCCGSIVAEDNFTCEDCFQVLDWSE